jgi:hypothetical protein
MRKYTDKSPIKIGWYWYIGDEIKYPLPIYLYRDPEFRCLVFDSPFDGHLCIVSCLHGKWSREIKP